MKPVRRIDDATAAADDPKRLLDEERELRFTVFDKDTAWALGCRMRVAAKERGLPLAIAIHVNGQLLFHAALEGTSSDNDAWLDRKARVADRYGHSSFYVGAHFRSHGLDFDADARLPVADYSAKGGALPLWVRNVGAIGTVTVSGLPDHEDHAFVVEQVRDFLDQL